MALKGEASQPPPLMFSVAVMHLFAGMYSCAGHSGRLVRAPENRQGPPHREGLVRLQPDDHGVLRA